MFGDDGRYYESEAAWEFAYNEGCRAEMQRIWAAEAEDGDGDDGDDGDDIIGPLAFTEDEEIPF